MSPNVSYINPFIYAACYVLKVQANSAVRRGGVSLHRSGATSRELTVALGVTGDVTGAVLYGFSKETARSIVSRLVGEPIPIYDEQAESVMAELGSRITGWATAELEKVGYSCRIAPPTVVTGRGAYISTLDFHRLVMPLETDMGEIEISVALKGRKRPDEVP